MLSLGFSGWFQCRLATDPDPHDEPRGVSGYVHAYVDEPDLDRIIYWSPPPFQRAHAPPIGVTVQTVAVNGEAVASHPLLGATATLLGQPMFEGRNGVIADDGREPIFPFDLQISAGDISLRRAVAPRNQAYPFEGMFAVAFKMDPDVGAEMARLTGITEGLSSVWRRRLDELQRSAHEADAQGRDATALRERIAFINRNIDPETGAARFFNAVMGYDYTLESQAEVVDPGGALGDLDFERAWRARFRMGGWDADTLCGYVNGSLMIPFKGEQQASRGRGSRRP